MLGFTSWYFKERIHPSLISCYFVFPSWWLHWCFRCFRSVLAYNLLWLLDSILALIIFLWAIGPGQPLYRSRLFKVILLRFDIEQSFPLWMLFAILNFNFFVDFNSVQKWTAQCLTMRAFATLTISVSVSLISYSLFLTLPRLDSSSDACFAIWAICRCLNADCFHLFVTELSASVVMFIVII